MAGRRLTSLLLLPLLLQLGGGAHHEFEVHEATVDDIHAALERGELTSRQLVEHYQRAIRALNPLLRAVVEENPDALAEADRADRERRRSGGGPPGGLHGVPVLLKDSIGTAGGLNTTAGSLALLGAVARRDAGVVEGLRKAGAVILGKASMTEWANFRSLVTPAGWSARSGQGRNPYVLSATPCGSSSGSAIAVAASMAAVSLGTETDGSILCPASAHALVGIKPTVGLTSRAGVVPLSPRQDTVGPICRTVSDAVRVLDAIAGYDPRDSPATEKALELVPHGGYRQFLRKDGLRGKRLGILRTPFFEFPSGTVYAAAFERHFRTLRRKGAILVDDLEIASTSVILDLTRSGELKAMLAEFKASLNAYLSELPYSPVRSLKDVIAFNEEHGAEQERMEEFGQGVFLEAQNTSGVGPDERRAIAELAGLSRDGLEKLMREEHLDAVVTPEATASLIRALGVKPGVRIPAANASPVLAIGGYPGITVPAGYDADGVPFGICFGGLKGSEPTLIQIAYAFEQATKIRRPPSFQP